MDSGYIYINFDLVLSINSWLIIRWFRDVRVLVLDFEVNVF